MLSEPCLEEIEAASLNLQKDEIRFSTWVEESKDILLKLKTARIINHQNVLEDVKDLEKKIKEFKQLANIKEFSSEQQQELDALNDEIQKLSLASTQKLEIKEQQSKKLKENESTVKQKSEDVSSKETNINKQLEKLDKGINYFQEYLGLKVERQPETHLTFTFTQINEKNPDQEFSFDLAVEGTPGEYKVRNCSCLIDDMEILLHELNENNNLKHFLCKLRNAFKKTTV